MFRSLISLFLSAALPALSLSSRAALRALSETHRCRSGCRLHLRLQLHDIGERRECANATK